MTKVSKLFEFMKEQGISGKQLSEATGIPTSTISGWKTGRSLPSADALSKLSSYFGVSVDYLLGNDAPLESNVAGMTTNNIFRVPLFESVSAGFGSYADSQIKDYYEVFVESHFVAKQTIAIKVKGDSMAPKIEDGDIILVQKNGEVRNGEIGVAMIEDEAFVKKIEYSGDTVTLVSINPNYPPRVFSGKNAEQVRIVGRVYRIIKEC